MVNKFLGSVAVLLALSATSACGSSETVSNEAGASPGATPGPTPSGAPCHGHGINLHQIKSDNGNRAAASEVDDQGAAKRAQLTPGDSRSFMSHVTKAQLTDAGINVSTAWSDNLIIIVNHGSFTPDQVHQPPPPAMPVPMGATAAPTLSAGPTNWQVFIYDKSSHDLLGSAYGVDGDCFHD